MSTTDTGRKLSVMEREYRRRDPDISEERISGLPQKMCQTVTGLWRAIIGQTKL